jgi:hypothetical protein
VSDIEERELSEVQGEGRVLIDDVKSSYGAT